MENKEVLDMCRRLATKYRNYQEYDDLVSTGVVTCLELRAKGEKSPATLYHRARDAMSDYTNRASSPLTYSLGRQGRDKVKENDYEFLDQQVDTVRAESVDESYELKNSLQKLMKILTDKERKVLIFLYRNNNNVKETAEALDVDRWTVNSIRKDIREKIVTICDLTLHL
jgi:RNA polymerase sigma factor (sigma-70 family)